MVKSLCNKIKEIFKGYNLQEFFSKLDSPDKCKKYLYRKHKHALIAGSLFHQLKFDRVKVFRIVFFLSTHIKGVSHLELHRRTCK